MYSKIVRNILYPLDRWRTGDYGELSYLREFEQTQFLPADELRSRSLEHLQQLVKHAYAECPFYRRQFERVGLLPRDISSLEDLAAFPILEKRDIQEHREEMVAKSYPRDQMIRDQTGGSTGAPISYYLARERVWSRMAAAIRHNRWAGYDIGDKIAMVWGAPPDAPSNSWKSRLRNLLIDRALYLDTANITEAKLQSFHEALNRFRPKVIQAYARSLALFSRYLQSRNLQVYQPRAIITSAEVLNPSDRALVESVFGCRVFDRYGCREFSVVASECMEHDGLHIMAEGLHVEVVRGGQPCRPGEVGAVVVTDLLNLAMPLIRYRIGDMAASETSSCRCGRGLPRLKGVEGRVTDFLVGSDGRLVSGVFLATYVISKRSSLGQVRLIQNARGRVLYLIEADPNGPQVGADIEFLVSATKRFLGPDTEVKCEFVEELSEEASGKFLYCQSSVACDFVDASTPS